jgi:hypothetical protein
MCPSGGGTVTYVSGKAPLLSFSGARSIFYSGSQRLSPKPLLLRRGVRITPRRTIQRRLWIGPSARRYWDNG